MKKVKKCECPKANPLCCDGKGPAAYKVKRNGKVLWLCTRCDFFSDEKLGIHKQLLTMAGKTLIEFDSLGAVCVGWDIREKKYPLLSR